MTAFLLSSVLTCMTVFPYLPVLPARAGTGDTVVLTSAHGDYGGDHKLYCIDKGGYAFWGIADDGDVYECHRPSELSLAMTQWEKEYVFWGLLTLQASLGIREAADVVAKIRVNAQAVGRKPITNLVTEEDLKALIYSAEIREKYPWLDEAAAHTEEYLRMGGLLAGKGTGNGSTGGENGEDASGRFLPSGKTVPEVLVGSTSLGSAFQVNSTDFTLYFDETGADAEFIRQVPLLFSNDNGLTFQPEPTDGWMYQKTDTAIIFTNPNPNPPKALIRFAAEGTEFASAGGYRSEQELFEECLQIWECTKCSGNHQGGTPPTSETWHHQRMVWMEFQPANVGYYAALAGGAVSAAGDGSIEFEIFRHEEDFRSHYNLQLYKYDSETGKALSGARFALYERFDDAGEIDRERDGREHLYIGGEDYAGGHTDAKPVWGGFRKAASVVTGENGHAEQSVEHGYHFDKTFCNGHPAPAFVPVPEAEEEEETGEVLNEDAIEEAKTRNRKLAADWLSCEADCAGQAEGDYEGVHFHWILDGVDTGEIEETAENGGSEGKQPDAGTTDGADGETSFVSSGCQEDRDNTYERFISLRYSYAWQEFQARDGYVRHALHADDLPIEIITTDASEHGANAVFSGEYSEGVEISGAAVVSAEMEEVQFSVHEVSKVKSGWKKDTEWMENFVFIDEDGYSDAATPSEPALFSAATPSETRNLRRTATASELEELEEIEAASASEALFSWSRGSYAFRAPGAEENEDMTAELFPQAYEAALLSESVGEEAEPGPSGNFSHCNNADGEGDAWRIYDHRTEGEFHINKKDMDLAAGESEQYDAYGDTQGDAALEGAVYGLFAAEDIVHPDGKTGVVYQAGDLAATAVTDKNGDASFLVYTQAPGRTYDYELGSVTERAGGFSARAPENLYDTGRSLDDYTEDHRYEREYRDNKTDNGNCWIGRPLILGDYYVKELSRSEGYELSIGNKMQDLTNRGQETEAGSSGDSGEEASGYAVIVKNLSAEEQTSEDGRGAGPEELFFSAESKDTGEDGYALVLTGLPEDTTFYRKEVGTAVIETEVGTGIWEKVFLANEDGTPRYLRAEHDYQYPKYHADGTLMTREVPVNVEADCIRQVTVHPIDEETIKEVLSETDGGMSEEEMKEYLSQPFAEEKRSFVKEKVEKILRRNKKATPEIAEENAETEYAPPVQTVTVDQITEDGTALTVAGAILQVLSFYDSHPYYSFGGIEDVKVDGEQFLFTVYASVSGHPEYFMVPGSDEKEDSLIFHRISRGPENPEQKPRYVYVSYSNNPDYEAFGTYEAYRSGQIGTSYVSSAVLVPAAAVTTDGTLVPKTVEENVYYKTGELVRDADGNPIPAFEYREITKKQTEEIEEVRWKTCSAISREDGTYVIFADPEYTDSYGVRHTDDGAEAVMEFKAVLKEKEIAISEGEAELLGKGFSAGHRMNSASYYVHVKQARVKASLAAEKLSLMGENSFLTPAFLSYPGQNLVRQDAGTRETPGQMFERVIRQKVRITKEIQGNANALPGFRFKVYLRSNLERLYRNEAGEVVWLTRTGEETEPQRIKHEVIRGEVYADVPKFYTKVPHRADSLTTGSVNNNVQKEAVTANELLYSFDSDGLIAGIQNTGYTRLLETSAHALDIQSGYPADAAVYNYGKFFDAIRTANHDKWDLGDRASTSHKPFPLISEPSEEARENQKVSDAVRQFAISWYLKEEVKKLTETGTGGIRQAADGKAGTQEEIYEKALKEAILKAENYLKPFFAYDLDEIYAVEWDSEAGGGSDGDKTTLSADSKGQNCYHGTSLYLPYGIYVAVEQQPEISQKGDFYNRHYRTDLPKEILIPSLYDTDVSELEAALPKGELSYDSFYQYHSADTPEQLAAKYQIRMNEEWGVSNQADQRTYVVRGHNHDGDFEIYPYGLEPEKRKGIIRYEGGNYSYAGFSFLQDEFSPYKSLYETEDPACADAYRSNLAVGKYYHYGSVSEQAGTQNGTFSITGALTGYDGVYFQALVPWTVTEPAGTNEADTALEGYAEKTYQNTFYTSKLRLEKLDEDTGENILHDGALFTIYRAEREENKDGAGGVKFYEKDTVIAGSREFLEAMGADEITPVARGALPWEVPYHGRYYGTIPAGTPVCREEEQVILTDEKGNRTGTFRAFSTVRDGILDSAAGNQTTGNQTAGFLETPQPLGAGCYVLCEVKAPAGYVKSRPVAVELYSDEVAYYLDGAGDNRVRAAVYGDVSRVYLNNSPIRLEISKTKPEEKTAEYELNGRLEGSLTSLKGIYGLENLELAYNRSGTYLGYGWKKGFLDALKKRQKAGEDIEVLYENGVFTGKAILTRPRETADDVNSCLPGALLTLYDAIEVKTNGNSEDYHYDGVNVVRDRFGNVENIYVQKGYAGRKICYVLDKTDPDSDGLEEDRKYLWSQQEDDTGTGVWTIKTVEREDTDILFYDLGGLSVLWKNGQECYALKDGTPFLEILCPDAESLHYSSKDRVFDAVPEGTKMYHLDDEGIRDSLVDPYTGMAYVTEESTGKTMVWPVKVSRDSFGNITAREKIRTSRPATVYANTKEEYTIGAWTGSEFLNYVNPVLNEYGQPEYYQRSLQVYQKGRPVYDRDGDYVRYRHDDKLNAYNWNAWSILRSQLLLDTGNDPKEALDDYPLHHRQGEACLIENTWTTGERTPDDPFRTEMTDGQADVLKRVPAGNYILEEVRAPSGYVKAMPSGLTVTEQTKVQKKRIEDVPISVLFEKTDAPEQWKFPVIDKDGILSEQENRLEGKAGYSYESVKGTEFALYPAKRVSTTDLESHPSGYRLEKLGSDPVSWAVPGETGEKRMVTARWTVGEEPQYFEGIPKGLYVLEEISAPPGFLPVSMEVEIKESEKLQSFSIPNDHTKLEILKYIEQDGVSVSAKVSDGVTLALYEAVLDEAGEVIKDSGGVPQYQKDRLIDQWTATDCSEYINLQPAGETTAAGSFTETFEALYKEYGPAFASVSWQTEEGAKSAVRIAAEQTDMEESVRQRWKTADGQQILIAVSGGLKEDGTSGFTFDYKFNYRELTAEGSPHAVSYDTIYGTHRLDYLDCAGGKTYVLAELTAPEGCRKAEPKVITPEETADIQLFGLKNEPGYLEILKVTEGEKPLPGAEMALYRADENGEFTDAEEALVETWVSGSDGCYTKEEEEAGKIPEGMEAGDIRPHRISPLAEGNYYLAELTAPKGFVPMQPKKVIFNEETPTCMKAENEMKKGRVVIRKRDAEDTGKGLSGAVYELTNLDTKEKWKFVTGEDGIGKSELLTTGVIKDGVWIPYRFALQEIRPPRYHVLDRKMRIFSFKEAEQSLLIHEEELFNEPTKITIAKSDFGTGLLLSGAELAVYRIQEQDGVYEAVGEPLYTWISDGKAHEICGKLSAGETYLLMELSAPEGYTKKEPVLFALTDDGGQISGISSDTGVISFRTSMEFPDQVEAVSVWGRQALGTRRLLTELESGNVIEIPEGSEAALSEMDGLKEGALYEEKEETYFSDGSSRVTGRTVFSMKFDENGVYIPGWRLPEETILSIWETGSEDSDSGVGSSETEDAAIAAWTVENSEEEGYLHIIQNPEYEERSGISTVSRNGACGEAILPGTVLRYEICCVNTGDAEKDMRINVRLDEQTEWMPANSDTRFRGGGALLTAEISGLKPGEEERIILAAAVIPEAEGQIVCKVTIDGQEFREVHPIGASGTVTLLHRVTGTAARTVNREFSYQLYFYDKEGAELKGTVPYQRFSANSQISSGTGVIRSGDIVTLENAGTVIFSGLPWGTVCRAEEVRESRQDSELEFQALSDRMTEAETGREPVSLRFSYEKRDGSDRELFRKNTGYVLKETTGYSDGTVLSTGSQSFRLDESGLVTWMELPNEKVELQIEKRDQETGEPVEGAFLQVFRKERKETASGISETLLEQWDSDSEGTHLIQAAVRPGESLILREKKAPAGYGTADEMEFTVPEEGGLLSVRMEDRPIQVKICKLALSRDGETELGPLAGAVIRIEEEDGTEIFRFKTGSDGTQEIPPVLEAGKMYLAVEETAPAGYEIAAPVAFSIPEEGGEITVVIYDRKKDIPERSEGGSEETKKSKIPGLTEGTITVHYSELLSGSGSVSLPYRRLSPLPSTGENGYKGMENISGFAAAGFFLLAALLLIQKKRTGSEWGKEKKAREKQCE